MYLSYTFFLKKSLLVLLLIVSLVPTVYAQNTNTWTGQLSTDWHTAANWSLTAIPTTSDDVVIPSSPTNAPVLSNSAVANSVEVQGGASLSITGTGSLTLNGSREFMVSSVTATTAFFNSGTVVMGGQLVIGNTSNVGELGLWNYGGSFRNETGASIHIDKATTIGLWNLDDASFVNSASITIGSSSASEIIRGLWNYGSSFRNETGASIQINNSTTSGLENTSSFVNVGSIIIGASGKVANYGLLSTGSFRNEIGASIHIDRSTIYGLWNNLGSFVNSASITIGSSSTVGGMAIENYASFSNEGCRALILVVNDGIINNSGGFSNTGTIIENATGNSSISSNAGVVVNNNGGIFDTGSGPNLPLNLTTTCNPPKGSLILSGLQASTTYTLSYTLGGTASNVVLSSDATGVASLSGLDSGQYSLLLSGTCLAQPLPLSITLSAFVAQILSLTADESACPVRLLGQGVGTSFVFTNNQGYVFSHVYRVGGTHSAVGLDVKQPGVYTLTARYNNECGSSEPITRTVTVGRSCP